MNRNRRKTNKKERCMEEPYKVIPYTHRLFGPGVGIKGPTIRVNNRFWYNEPYLRRMADDLCRAFNLAYAAGCNSTTKKKKEKKRG